MTSTQQDLLLARLAEERRELQLAIKVVRSAVGIGLAEPQELSAVTRKLALIEEKVALRERQNQAELRRRGTCFKFSEALLQSSSSNPWRPSGVRTS